MQHTRRHVMGRAAAAAAASLMGGFPAMGRAADLDPLTFIVGYAAGGPFDTLARRVGQEITRQAGRPVVVENRSGAGSTIATAAAIRAKPDGNTVYIAASPALTVAPHMYKAKVFAPGDLQPVALISEYPNVLIVGADSPFKSAAELLGRARSQPGKVSYGSAGIGASNHLAAEMLKISTGTSFLHVPYRGSGPALAALLGGEIDFMFIDVSGVPQQLAAGKIKALAITSAQRNAALPDVLTFEELGVKDCTMSVWVGAFAPKDVPRDKVQSLENAIVSATADANTAKAIRDGGHTVLGQGPAALARKVEQDYAFWGKVVRAASIQAD